MTAQGQATVALVHVDLIVRTPRVEAPERVRWIVTPDEAEVIADGLLQAAALSRTRQLEAQALLTPAVSEA